MAKILWGKVYFRDQYVGRLQEEPGGSCVFRYDAAYLEAGGPAIAYTLPLQAEPFFCERGLHPFFDNLVAEGWLREAQAKALGLNPNNRFGLLLGFGRDLAGAVSIVDPEQTRYRSWDPSDAATTAALLGRASLSGVQAKLLLVKEAKGYRPVGPQELSTHIAKLASGHLADLLDLEYLSTLAVKQLLPGDEVVEIELSHLPSIQDRALIITRFDRTPSAKRLHFEEFNQLLGRYSGDDKYAGSYEEMGQFILKNSTCIPAEADRLLSRLLACFLVGNTDAHFKNFAMFHTQEGLRLTPAYDLVAASLYPQYQSIALKVCGTTNLLIGSLLPKHLLRMAKDFGVSGEALVAAVETMQKRLPMALQAVAKAKHGSKLLKDQLNERIEKRWNGSFKLIGQLWWKRQGKGVKSKS